VTHHLLVLLQAAPSQGSRGLLTLVWYVVGFGAIFYFLIIRPKAQQEKKHRERISQLKRGDKVVTVGGILGEVVHLKEDRVTIKSGESRLIIQRDRVADILDESSSS
jgi:preprotein translocase subunit YajC